MTPPKTLHLTNAYHATSGGVRTFYHALMAAAEDRQRIIRLVVPAARPSVERHGRYGVVHEVAAPPAPWFDDRYRILWPAHYWRRQSPIVRILAAERAEVVEVNDKYGLCLLGQLLRRGWLPHVPRPTLVGHSCERMDDNVAAHVGGAAWLRAASSRYLRHVYLPSFDVHLANSSYTAEELRVCHGQPDVEISPPGVDADLFGAAPRDSALRASLLAAAGGQRGDVLVFYAGRLSREKNMTLLLDAVGVLGRRFDGAPCGRRDVRLVVAGDGPHAPALQAHAACAAPGRVAFIGHVHERRDLATHYASADVFAHPNPREPFGIGPLEAMATGVPVVAPRAGGVLTYANEANAWLAAPEPEAFADAIGAAARGRASVRVQRARETARAYAWPVMAGRHFELLDRRHAARLALARRDPLGANASADCLGS